MTITYKEWQDLSESFANEAIARLKDFARTLKPEPDPEPVKALWDENNVRATFRALMAHALLSVVKVERPST